MPANLDEEEEIYQRGWEDGQHGRIALKAELAEARAQIAAKDAEIARLTQRNWATAIREQDELNEARAQIAAKDAALDALDEAHQITQQNLWQDITELRASLAGKEQEHQDFRLQNDAEWRAKLDHLKAQIAAKDAALQRLTDGMQTIATSFYKGDQYQDYAKHVLAAPARETE